MGAAEQPRAAAPRGAPGPPAERQTAYPSFCSATKAVFPADPPSVPSAPAGSAGRAPSSPRPAARAPSRAVSAFRSAAPLQALPPVCFHYPFRRLSSYGRRGDGRVLLALASVKGARSALPLGAAASGGPRAPPLPACGGRDLPGAGGAAFPSPLLPAGRAGPPRAASRAGSRDVPAAAPALRRLRRAARPASGRAFPRLFREEKRRSANRTESRLLWCGVPGSWPPGEGGEPGGQLLQVLDPGRDPGPGTLPSARASPWGHPPSGPCRKPLAPHTLPSAQEQPCQNWG